LIEQQQQQLQIFKMTLDLRHSWSATGHPHNRSAAGYPEI